jgi:asparagine N-glycosylation enzyme membrane subunit Stt3
MTMVDFSLGAPLGLPDQSVITFLFVLAVIFGVLELTNLFKNRAVNLLIALALSAFAASQVTFTSLLFSYLPGVTGFFIVVFFIAFTFEILGVRKRKPGADLTDSMVVGGAVMLVLFTVGFSLLQMFPIDIPYIGGASGMFFIVGLVLLISLFWSAMHFGGGGGGKLARGGEEG